MTIIIERGTYQPGMTQRHTDGTTTDTPPKWDADATGGCVVVCEVDPETREQKGEADLFAAWDTHGIGKRIAERLGTAGNIPDFVSIAKQIGDFCDHCEGNMAMCSICPVHCRRTKQ